MLNSLEKDTKNRNLGMRNHICKICNSSGNFQSYLVREMMKGTKDEFEYFVCPNCGCLQISEIPENLGEYYDTTYYSMKFEPDFSKLSKVKINNMTKILDVGCGSGEFLFNLAYEGHGNLYGCDPFIKEDIMYEDRINIKKCEISEIAGSEIFDVIKMGDSLEHVVNPLEVLQSASRLIRNDGIIIIDTPHFPNFVFDIFGSHWYQLDAPRHLFIYSEKTIEWLAEKSSLSIDNLVYASNELPFIMSFFYQHGVTYHEVDKNLIKHFFTDDDIEKIAKMCEEEDEKNNGDHMRIFLKKLSGKS